MTIRRALTAGAALLAAAVLSTTPAHATGLTYAVTAGGSSAPGSAPFSATPSGALAIAGYTCTGPTSSTGTISRGPSVLNILSASLTTSGCGGMGSATITFSGGWLMHGTSPATSATNDVVSVHLHGVNVTVNGGTICRFTATGQLDGSFDEATQTLTINETAATSDLIAANVIGCFGIVKSGGGVPVNVSLVTPSALYLG